MSKKFIAILLGAFIVVGGLFFWTLYNGSQVTPHDLGSNANVAQGPHVPPPPSVGLFVQASTTGNMFRIEWQNLPDGTVALNILRRLKGKPDSLWLLWKQIALTQNDLASGKASFNIGSSSFAEYSFSIQAVGNLTGQGVNGTTTIGQVITWVSTSTTPIVVTSTPPTTPPPASSPSSSPTSSLPSTSPTSTPTSTLQTPTSTPTSTPSASSSPQGIPYYSPEIQLSGYGYPPAGSFWVQHINQKIEIGWQNIPAQATTAGVYRANSADGPWTVVFKQNDIDTVGPYTIQLVDNTLNQPYYYQMNAKSGSSILATYGPVLLPAAE